jgi:uncharacterized Ntn-hydrolase superfamily protein
VARSYYFRCRFIELTINKEKAMTFTVAIRSPKDQRIGVGVTTCSIAAGGLCLFYSKRGDLVVSQAYASPADGYRLAEYLNQGMGPADAFEKVRALDNDISYRQILVVPVEGPIFAYTGENPRPWCGHLVGENYVVAGNILAGKQVVEAMERVASPHDKGLEEMLLQSMEAGRDAGGQATPAGAALTERSAALKITSTGEMPCFPLLDLRVDLHHSAVHEMRRLYEFHCVYAQYSAIRDRSPKDSPSMVEFEAAYIKGLPSVIERPSIFR